MYELECNVREQSSDKQAEWCGWRIRRDGLPWYAQHSWVVTCGHFSREQEASRGLSADPVNLYLPYVRVVAMDTAVLQRQTSCESRLLSVMLKSLCINYLPFTPMSDRISDGQSRRPAECSVQEGFTSALAVSHASHCNCICYYMAPGSAGGSMTSYRLRDARQLLWRCGVWFRWGDCEGNGD